MAYRRPSERWDDSSKDSLAASDPDFRGITRFSDQERNLLAQDRGLLAGANKEITGEGLAGVFSDLGSKFSYSRAQRRRAGQKTAEKYNPTSTAKKAKKSPTAASRTPGIADISDAERNEILALQPPKRGGKMVPPSNARMIPTSLGRYGNKDVQRTMGPGGIPQFFAKGEGGPRSGGISLALEGNDRFSPAEMEAITGGPSAEEITAKGNKALIKKWESMSPRERGRMPKSVADAYGIDQPARPEGAFGIHVGSRPSLEGRSYAGSEESDIVRNARMHNAIMRFPPGRQRRDAMQMMLGMDRNATERRGQELSALSEQAGLLQDQREFQGLQDYRAGGLQNDANRLGLDRERMGLDFASGQLDRASEIEKALMTRSNNLADEQSRRAFEVDKVKLQEALKGRNAMTKSAMDRIDALQEFNPQAATLALQLVPVLAGNSKKYGANNPNLVLGTIQEELAAMQEEGGDIDMQALKARVLGKFAKQKK